MVTDNLSQSRMKIEELADLGKGFVENKIEWAKLNAAEKVINGSSKVVTAVIVGFFSFFIILFLSVGTAFWIGKAYGDMAMGFFIVALIFVAVMVLALLIGLPLLSNSISKSIFGSLNSKNK
jgi:uncharacterized membrane protein